ncbi:MAG: HEPN protein [uncultured bacterium]|nr:MAG: HEPN protein [uncultured bacterium]KKP26491.1 MAG: HEPN domain protein [candidate division TM6 bacterium GW2011_GWF2_30_66]
MQEHEKWLQIAKEDLKSAKILLKHELFGTVVYHCQQASEKSLKGYLAFKKQELLKTHDLVKLLELCALFDKKFDEKQEAAKYINPFATKFRYPADYNVLKYDEALQAVKYTISIVKFIEKKFSEQDIGQKNIFIKSYD